MAEIEDQGLDEWYAPFVRVIGTAGPFGSCGFPDFCDCDQRDGSTFPAAAASSLVTPGGEE